MLETVHSIPVDYYVFYATVLFVIGIFGVLTRRNAIVVLMCIELMLNAVNLLLAAFSTYLSDAQGQIMVFFIMVVAAAEAAVSTGAERCPPAQVIRPLTPKARILSGQLSRCHSLPAVRLAI